MRLRVLETQLSVRDSSTRLPFRYGVACLTWCPQATLRIRIETEGVVQDGFSGDCLPPSWFDKSPDKDYDQQIDEMKQSIELAGELYADAFRDPQSFFESWWGLQGAVQQAGREKGWPGLLAGFGSSLVERAMIDAAARARRVSFFELIRDNHLRIDPARFDERLATVTPRNWLPDKPRDSLFVRHTVGLSDPLTVGEISADERLDDRYPQALEEYLVSTGLRYLKIKVGNDLERDLDRLEAIAHLMEKHRGTDYRVTLDGNEQYRQPADFDSLVEAIRGRDALATIWQNALVIEQPLARDIALSPEHTRGIRDLAEEKPVIIDESDESLESYHAAIELGYRGVSSKNCKGPLRSLLNAGLTWHLNQQAGPRYLMTAEDLCCVGIVPLQADLCLIATLGLDHVERNGHHYHPGLSYLPSDVQQAAITAHPDLYGRVGDVVWPRVVDGQFRINSLQCVGFGFDVVPEP